MALSTVKTVLDQLEACLGPPTIESALAQIMPAIEGLLPEDVAALENGQGAGIGVDGYMRVLVTWLSLRYRERVSREEQARRLLKLLNFGNKLGFAGITVQLFEKELRNPSSCIAADYWSALQTSYAKGLRKLGRFEAAIHVYHQILREANITDDEFTFATTLLNMGKMAHTHDARVGYYQCLVKAAEHRFYRVERHPAVQRKIAICIDSDAMVQYEIYAYQDGLSHTKSSPLRLRNTLETRWNRAFNLACANDNTNSRLRIECRRSFVLFHLTESRSEKKTYLDAFRMALNVLENMPNEVQGLGVRYGQYAEMLARLEDYDAAQKYIADAIAKSAASSDWRGVAINHVRRSQIYCDFLKQDPSEIVQALDLCLKSLQSLPAVSPEVEIKLRRELALRARNSGDFAKSTEQLRATVMTLRRLERRLFRDIYGNQYGHEGLDPDTLSEHLAYIPPGLLGKAEETKLRQSQLLDYQILSGLMREVMFDLQNSMELSGREQSAELQYHFSFHLLQSWAHEYKDRIRRHLYETKRVLQQCAASERGVDVGTALQDAMDQVASEQDKLEEGFRQLLRGIVHDGKYETPESVSVSEVARDVTSRSSLGSLYPGVRVNLHCGEAADFMLLCNRHLLRSVLLSLIDNAARYARQAKDGAPPYVNVAVEWRRDEQESGVIVVEDSGGDLASLRRGLEKPSWGLLNAIMFFKAFEGDLKIEGQDGVSAKLVIKIPRGQRTAIIRR